ncbi:MAG: repeat-associated core protein [Gammaproteobacteria bacterium]|nr:repeat-associated core protein [Gammaproteobacteria bacterium]
MLSAAAFIFRSRRYEDLHADPAISRKTDFFAAASLVTAAFALITPSRFFCELSETLESANVARARKIRARQLYAEGTNENNTTDFVRYEQELVQAALDSLRRRHPQSYWREIDSANRLLNALNGKLLRRTVLSSFARAVRSTITNLGADIDFARQDHREALGRQLAREACRSRPGLDAG